MADKIAYNEMENYGMQCEDRMAVFYQTAASLGLQIPDDTSFIGGRNVITEMGQLVKKLNR